VVVARQAARRLGAGPAFGLLARGLGPPVTAACGGFLVPFPARCAGRCSPVGLLARGSLCSPGSRGWRTAPSPDRLDAAPSGAQQSLCQFVVYPAGVGVIDRCDDR
jgi:hypothetical protein